MYTGEAVMQKTGCCEETRVVLHVPIAHHKLECIKAVINIQTGKMRQHA